MDFDSVGANAAFPLPPPTSVYDLDPGNGNGRRLFAVLVAMLVFGTVFVGLRLFTRVVILRMFGWDDLAISIALLFGNAYTAIGIFGVFKNALGRNTSAIPPQDFQSLFVMLNKLAYTGGIIYIISAYVGRASVILLILRFKPSRFMTRTYIGLFVLNSIFFVLMFLINILRCVPPSLLWTTDLSVELTKDPRCKLHTKAVAKMGAPINITLNVLTFCLPLHFLMRLDIEKRERIQLSFAFLIGLMTIVGSGMQIRVAEKFEDFANMYVNMGEFVMWTTVEIQTLAACASFPVLKALRRAIKRRFRSSPKTTPLGSDSTQREKFSVYGLNGPELATRVESFTIPRQHSSRAPTTRSVPVVRQVEAYLVEPDRQSPDSGDSYSVESFRFGTTRPDTEPSENSTTRNSYMDLGAFSSRADSL